MKLNGKVALITGLQAASDTRSPNATSTPTAALSSPISIRPKPRRRQANWAIRKPRSEFERRRGKRGRRSGRRLWLYRCPCLECRHPDRAPDRGVPVWRLEEDISHPSRRRVPDHEGLRQIHVQTKFLRVDLHGFGAQSRGLTAQVRLCCSQARHLRTCAPNGEGRNQAQRARQRHLPWFRDDAPRAEADPGAGQGAASPKSAS
jgi:hypothetical protein